MFDTRIETDAQYHEAATPDQVTCLPHAVITALLDVLGEDDAFRARFESDPRAALRDIGYETPASQRGVAGCDPVLAFAYFHGGLASKQAILAGRERWLAQLRASERVFGPFDLCA
jgi:putative modified peptide